MSGSVNKVYQSLSAQLSQFTEQTVRETFGLPSASDYFVEEIAIGDGQVREVSLEDDEQELEQELQRVRAEAAALEKSAGRLQRERTVLLEQLQVRERAAADRHSRELRALGARPSAEVRYQTQYRTVKVFLWITREEAYQEPYLDYTAVEEYERRLQAEQTRCEQERAGLRQLLTQLDEKSLAWSRLEREKQLRQNELEALRREQALRARRRQEQWQKERAKMLDRKKYELTLACRDHLAAAFRQLNSAVIAKNADAMEHLIQLTDKLLDEVLVRYRAQLQTRIDRQSRVSFEDLEELVKRAEAFEREIKEEGMGA